MAALGLAVAVLAPEVAALCCGFGLGGTVWVEVEEVVDVSYFVKLYRSLFANHNFAADSIISFASAMGGPLMDTWSKQTCIYRLDG